MNIKINKSKVREISELEWGDVFRVCGEDSIYMLINDTFCIDGNHEYYAVLLYSEEVISSYRIYYFDNAHTKVELVNNELIIKG